MPLCKECDTREKAPGRSKCYACYGRYRRGQPKPCYIAPGPMRILFLDIETSPNVAYVWDFFKAMIGPSQIIHLGEILCFSAKWFGDDELLFYDNREDRLAMIQAAWNLLDQADVVIHYYGSEFDVKWLNREFLENGFPPPRPFKQLDLKKIVAKSFRFPSNKLQVISTKLGLAGKVDHEGFPLWTKCMDGDEEAWGRMEEYNRQDVVLLEELYEMVLPWIPAHPHRSLYGGSSGCPTCGFEALEDAGFTYTKVSKFAQYRCPSCGSFFRDSRRLSGVTIQESVL